MRDKTSLEACLAFQGVCSLHTCFARSGRLLADCVAVIKKPARGAAARFDPAPRLPA